MDPTTQLLQQTESLSDDIRGEALFSLLVYNNKYKTWLNNSHRLDVARGNFDLTQKQQALVAKYAPEVTMVFFCENLRGLECAVVHNRLLNRFSVVFRGSESFSDFVHDAFVCKTHISKDHPDVKVHSGFWSQLTGEDTYHTLETFVVDTCLLHPSAKWFVSGHSLGGALAVLFATTFRLRNLESSTRFHAIAIGSPRVGNQAFTDLATKHFSPFLTITRITDARDPITRVPRFWYKHTSTNQFKFYKGTWHSGDKGAVPKTTWLDLLKVQIKTHSISHYGRILDKL